MHARREVVVERSSGLPVCPISATVRDDLRSGALGPDGEREAGDGDEEGADEAPEFGGGRLASAFVLGYYAESLEQCSSLRFRPARRR